MTDETHTQTNTSDVTADTPPTTDRVGLSDVSAPLVELIEPTLESIGFQLAHLEVEGGSRKTLRVFIDGPNGVTIDDCARASRHMSTMLEVEDPIPGAYALEVSSPGVDRPLGRRIDWEHVVGETVMVRSRRPVEGRKRWTGTLLGLDGDDANIEVDGQTHRIPLALVQKANLKYSFDKPRTGEGS